MSTFQIEPTGICQSCHKRKATVYFSEGPVATIHGCYELICLLCCKQRQLAHAEELVGQIDGLRIQVDKLKQELPELTEEELKSLSVKYPEEVDYGLTLPTFNIKNMVYDAY
jgi:hypothetical protein